MSEITPGKRLPIAFGPLALGLSSPADCGGVLASTLLRRLFIMPPELHLAIDTFPLKLLFEGAKGLVDIVVTNEDLHAVGFQRSRRSIYACAF